MRQTRSEAKTRGRWANRPPTAGGQGPEVPRRPSPALGDPARPRRADTKDAGEVGGPGRSPGSRRSFRGRAGPRAAVGRARPQAGAEAPCTRAGLGAAVRAGTCVRPAPAGLRRAEAGVHAVMAGVRPTPPASAGNSRGKEPGRPQAPRGGKAPQGLRAAHASAFLFQAGSRVPESDPAGLVLTPPTEPQGEGVRSALRPHRRRRRFRAPCVARAVVFTVRPSRTTDP